MNYNKMNNESRNYNNLEKTKDNLSKYMNDLNSMEQKKISKKPIKYLDSHESIFEHVNINVKPYARTCVCALFTGVKYRETDFGPVNIRYILNEAIEKYLNYAAVKPVDEKDFIDFVNKTFHIEIVSIDSIKLKLKETQSQEAEVSMGM